MAGKLKSISKRIHWSLVVKAGIFGAAWFSTPFPLFLLVAAWLFFVPLFDPLRLFLQFAVVLVIAAFLPETAFSALFLATLFFLLLGIKELVFINRRAAYETFLFILLFVIFLNFFSHFTRFVDQSALFVAFALSLLSSILLGGFVNYSGLGGANRKQKFFALALAGFLVMAMLTELLVDYFTRELVPARLMVYFSAFFVFLTFLLVSNQWGLS